MIDWDQPIQVGNWDRAMWTDAEVLKRTDTQVVVGRQGQDSYYANLFEIYGQGVTAHIRNTPSEPVVRYFPVVDVRGGYESLGSIRHDYSFAPETRIARATFQDGVLVKYELDPEE